MKKTFLDAKTATETGKTSAKTVQADRVTGMTLQVNTLFCVYIFSSKYMFFNHLGS